MANKLLKASVTKTVGQNSVTLVAYFRGPAGIYTGNIATQTGVSEAGANEQNEIVTPVGELVRKAFMIPVVAVLASGKRRKLFITQDKAATGFDGLETVALSGSTIRKVGLEVNREFEFV